MILVSSCLAGLKVRYDGTHQLEAKVQKLVEENQAVTICPELLGGLAVPREPAEIIGGSGADVLDGKAKVLTVSGKDVTEEFIAGAYQVLETVVEVKASKLVLKENSPSCGSSFIYNGSFQGKKKSGSGVTAALLIRNGIEVISEEEFMREADVK